MKTFYTKKEINNMSLKDYSEIIDSIINIRDDIKNSDINEYKEELENMSINDLIDEYEFYTGNFIFEN